MISESKCLFYEAEDIFEMLGLQKTAGYRYLEKVIKSGKEHFTKSTATEEKRLLLMPIISVVRPTADREVRHLCINRLRNS